MVSPRTGSPCHKPRTASPRPGRENSRRSPCAPCAPFRSRSSCRQFLDIGQALPALCELREKSVHCVQLSRAALKLVHGVAERRRAGQALGVPGNMLARHAYARVLAVELVELVQMREQYAVDLLHFRWRQVFPGPQVMMDLAEHPRPALRGAPDH